MPDGTVTTMAEAFAIAESEIAPADAGGAVTLPVTAETTETPPVGQPDVPETPDSDPQLQAMLDTMDAALDAPAEPTGTPDMGTDGWWAQQVDVETVDGSQRIPLSEMKDGYMRQADYTRKTTEAAGLRKDAEEAMAFLKSYRDDPNAFVRAVGVETGFLDPDAKPEHEVSGVRLPTQAEFDKMLDERVTERISSDSTIQRDRQAAARSAIATEFNEIGTRHGVTIPENLREEIVREAVQKGVNDLEMIFLARLAGQRQRTQQLDDLGAVATSRPGAPRADSMTPQAETPVPGKVYSMQDAWKEAAAEQQVS